MAALKKRLIRICCGILLFTIYVCITNDSTTNKKSKLATTPNARAIEKSHAEQYIRKNCTEQKNIYFLQVIKAGSTTIQNILWRYGLSRDLTFMIFRDKYPYPSANLEPKLVSPKHSNSRRAAHNIMAEHSVYNESAILEYLPEDTARIGIVRNTLSHLRSVFKYFKLDQRLAIDGKNVDEALVEFLQNPTYYMMHNHLPIVHNTQNRITMEFGYKHWIYRFAPEDFINYVEILDDKFNLVIVLEKLHESLILMKRYFCWSTKDILYLPIHQSAAKTATKILNDSREVLTSEMELSRAARDLSEQDAALYDYFVLRLQERIVQQSHDYPGEVTWFDHLINIVQSFCEDICLKVRKIRENRDSTLTVLYNTLKEELKIPESKWDTEFVVNGEECIRMALDPNVFRAVEFSRHYPEICEDNPREEVLTLAADMKFDQIYCGRKSESFPFSILTSEEIPLTEVLRYNPE